MRYCNWRNLLSRKFVEKKTFYLCWIKCNWLESSSSLELDERPSEIIRVLGGEKGGASWSKWIPDILYLCSNIMSCQGWMGVIMRSLGQCLLQYHSAVLSINKHFSTVDYKIEISAILSLPLRMPIHTERQHEILQKRRNKKQARTAKNSTRFVPGAVSRRSLWRMAITIYSIIHVLYLCN